MDQLCPLERFYRLVVRNGKIVGRKGTQGRAYNSLR